MNNLKKIVKNRKRLGRGAGSGWGTTAGRGTKGQKSRTGAKIPARFQGGHLPLWQRLPKRDGISIKNPKPIVLNLSQLEVKYSEGETVSFKSLEEKNLVIAKTIDKFGLKILATGKLTKKLKVDPEIKLSEKARAAFK